MLTVFVLQHLLNTVDLYLTNVQFILVLLQLNLCLIMSFLLSRCHTTKLHIHVLNLLRLSVVDVRLPSDLLVALFDLELCSFILLSHATLLFLRLRQRDLDIAQRIFQLFVLNLTQS